MGRRGPLPSSDKVRRAKGLPKRKAADGVVLKLQRPAPPDWLDAEARAEFESLVKELLAAGTVARLDAYLLATLALALTQQRKLATELADKQAGDGNRFALLKHLNALTNVVLKVSREFGLSPAARQRLKPVEDQEQQADPVMEYLGKRKKKRA